MFGHKRRHDEIIEQLEKNKVSCEELAREIGDLKEFLTKFDISHVLETMDSFIESASYITHLINNATIEDFPDSDECLHCHDICEECKAPNGE